jgi:hypothetical protein
MPTLEPQQRDEIRWLEVTPFEWVLLRHDWSSFSSFLAILTDQLSFCNIAHYIALFVDALYDYSSFAWIDYPVHNLKIKAEKYSE